MYFSANRSGISMSLGFSKAQVTLIILGDWSLFIISTLAEPITSFARGKFFEDHDEHVALLFRLKFVNVCAPQIHRSLQFSNIRTFIVTLVTENQYLKQIIKSSCVTISCFNQLCR